MILGIDGIWLSVSVAEIAALIVSAAFIIVLEPRYGYWRMKVKARP